MQIIVQKTLMKLMLVCTRICLRLCVILWVCAAPAYSADLEGIRFGENSDHTRIVIDASQAIKPRTFMLADPYRLVTDLPQATWNSKQDVKALGLVSGIRHGLFTGDIYRLVLDLKSPAVMASSFALAPNGRYGHRYVIDIKPTSRQSFLAEVQKTRPLRPVSTETASVPFNPEAKKRVGGKRVIVLDAGHGGPDPGNLGVIGVHEKVITLKIARAVRDELQRTGRYDVYLTRDRDIFHKVRERFRIARRRGAELFISIHADAINKPSVKGGSVYNLSETASDKEAARLAVRENKSDVIAGVNLEEADDEVSGILIELAQRETMNYSAQFAEILVGELKREIPMLRRAHRFANLGMLKAPDVPSVLLEAGYLTNKKNARLLNSKDGQKRIARAVRRAIDRYFNQMAALGR